MSAPETAVWTQQLTISRLDRVLYWRPTASGGVEYHEAGEWKPCAPGTRASDMDRCPWVYRVAEARLIESEASNE